jgi:peptide/nickel transport system substrate-binding protein
MASVGELKAVDAKTFTMVLKQPFGLVLEALGKPSSTVPFMMPKRVAETDPFKQIDDYTGSGPFIFKKDEWKPGDKIVYVKNTKYKPRAEPPSMLAGGKVVKIDRVEWIAISDPLTAVNALQQGEIDLIEVPVPDLFPMLKADKNITLFGWNALGSQIIMRFNHLHPPFNNLKARQAAMYAIAQEDLAPVGNPRSIVCNAPLVCGSPYEKSYGDLLIKPDYARQLLKESGYDGAIVMMQATTCNRPTAPAAKQVEKAASRSTCRRWTADWWARQRSARQGRRLSSSPPPSPSTPTTQPATFQRRLRQGVVRWPCDGDEKLAPCARVDPESKRSHAVSDRVMDQGLCRAGPARPWRLPATASRVGSPAQCRWVVSPEELTPSRQERAFVPAGRTRRPASGASCQHSGFGDLCRAPHGAEVAGGDALDA